MSEVMQKIVIPIKSYDGKKTWWHNAGITGVGKDGKPWGKIQSHPPNWDGYFVVVEAAPSKEGQPDEDAPSKGGKHKPDDEVPF